LMEKRRATKQEEREVARRATAAKGKEEEKERRGREGRTDERALEEASKSFATAGCRSSGS